MYDSLERKSRSLGVLGVARDKNAEMLYPLTKSSDKTLRAWESSGAECRRNKNNTTDNENSTVQEKSTNSSLYIVLI